MRSSDVTDRFRVQGIDVIGGSPAEFGTILTEAIEKWAKVIKFAGINVE